MSSNDIKSVLESFDKDEVTAHVYSGDDKTWLNDHVAAIIAEPEKMARSLRLAPGNIVFTAKRVRNLTVRFCSLAISNS